MGLFDKKNLSEEDMAMLMSLLGGDRQLGIGSTEAGPYMDQEARSLRPLSLSKADIRAENPFEDATSMIMKMGMKKAGDKAPFGGDIAGGVGTNDAWQGAFGGDEAASTSGGGFTPEMAGGGFGKDLFSKDPEFWKYMKSWFG